MTGSILYPTHLSILRCGSQLSLLDQLSTRDRSYLRRIVLCPPGDAFLRELERLDVRSYVAGRHPFHWQFTSSGLAGTMRDVMTAGRAAAEVTRRENVRLIHASSLASGLVGLYAKRRDRRIRMVLHERGLAYRVSTRHLFRMVTAAVDRVLVTTELGRSQLLAWGVAPAKIAVIPNGTEFHRREPVTSVAAMREALGVRQSVPMIGMVANVFPLKRHELFIEMIRRLPGVHGVIVGGVIASLNGAADYERELRTLVDKLGIRDRITFAGPRDDVADLMRAMDVLVCTSRHESFGRVLIEAMAVGTPVVATRVGAIPDVIDHGRTGILTEGNVDELVSAVRNLLDSPADAQRLAAAAREEVRRRFDVRDVTQRIENVYRELLDE